MLAQASSVRIFRSAKMASGITSAGSASGMDFESIIAASIAAKKNQINKTLTTRKEETKIELSGVGKLKSALETFQKSIKALTEDNGFNTRKVTTDLPTENPYFSISTKDDATNGSYDITVTQLAKNEKLTQEFDKDAKFEAGKLTITLPEVENEDGTKTKREFTIDIAADDNIASIRKKLNNNDFGVTATTVQLANGKTKLVIDSGMSGDKGNITMKFDGATGGNSDKFNVNSDDASATNKGWKVEQGQNAKINVDGEDLESQTNEFRNVISGITINVHRLSKQDDKGGFQSNNVQISADVDKVTEKMNAFVSAYNGLLDTMDALYEHNTYTDGKNNYDGGELSGDSMLRGLKNQLQNMMSNVSANSSGLDIYSVGIKIANDGKMSLDSTKFKENINDNFNTLVNMFSGKDDNDKDNIDTNGILIKLNNTVEEYTKGNGLLSNREDALNAKIKNYDKEEANNATYLEEYEASLRQRYARLDNTIAGYNSSLNYLMSALV